MYAKRGLLHVLAVRYIILGARLIFREGRTKGKLASLLRMRLMYLYYPYTCVYYACTVHTRTHVRCTCFWTTHALYHGSLPRIFTTYLYHACTVGPHQRQTCIFNTMKCMCSKDTVKIHYRVCLLCVVTIHGGDTHTTTFLLLW